MQRKAALSRIELDQQMDRGVWAVVCADLHACMAPFTKAEAEAFAERMTRMGDGCTYRAVSLIIHTAAYGSTD